MSRIPRRAQFLLALSLLAGLLPLSPAAAQTDPVLDPVYVTEGSGWGHGVGMSQYGAKAMAVKGFTADQIVTSYYAGTSVKPIDQVLDAAHWMRADATPLWIGLLQNQTTLAFQMIGGPAGLCKANDNEGTCPTQTANPGESWEFRALGGGQCQFFKLNLDTAVFDPVGNPGTCRASIEWTGQPEVRILFPGTGREYARGVIKIRPAGEGFHVIGEMGIEEYIYGIGEVPSSWPEAALQAQAIAARTYGVRQALRYGSPEGEGEASFDATRKAQCWCQLYATVVDQNYVGYQKETSQDGSRWVAAVNASAGRLVTHPEAEQSTVIVAYYSSSSGGHTHSNVDGLGHGTPIPYLPGIPDPWSVDPAAENPFASWTKSITASQIAAAVGLETVTGAAVTECTNSRGVAEVTVTGTLGGVPKVVTVSGRTFRSALGMRSVTYRIIPPADSAAGPSLDCMLGIPDAGFTDVSPDSVHKADIDYIAFYGVTTGVTPTTYAPLVEVSRWQMALFLTRSARLMGVTLPDGGDQGFTDLGGLSAETVTAINQLKQLGITTGTTETTFEPGALVSRWQMALFLTRLHSSAGFPLPDGSSAAFTDLQGLSAEAITAIGQLVEMGVSNGTSATTFDPAAAVTREQMASFLARLLRLDT